MKRANSEGSITYDKRRKRYRVRVTVGWELDEKTGKSKQIVKNIGSSFKTKGEATKALYEYQENPYDLNTKDITFSQLYEKWLPEYLVDHQSHRYRIRAAYKYCSTLYNKKFKDISILDMKYCINKGMSISTRGVNKGQPIYPSPTTKESIKYLFNHIYAYAIEARIVDRNWAREFTLDKKVSEELEANKKVKIPFSDEEMQKLWKSIEFVPFADMIVYACYSGWRPGELVQIKIENVHIDEKYISGGIKTKAGKNRTVPIHSKIADIVKKYYQQAIDLNSEYLFNDPEKKSSIMGMTYDQYLTRFNNALKACGFREEITPHYTRHTFITNAKKANVNEYILKIMVGHKIDDITEYVYTHREVQDLINEIEKIK